MGESQMTSGPPPLKRIAILREEVSRKIAAGEVIDRPLAVIRELLDNALDAGAGRIDVHLEAGGLSRIRVVDDGRGMSAEDLALCHLRHATSKIRDEEDLHRVASLGFRGEALASIAAVSRMQIISMEEGSPAAHSLKVHGGAEVLLQPCAGSRGTVVEVTDLFFNLPARRRFLKTAAAEGALCRQALLDKALAFPQTAFRLFTEGGLKLMLPPQALLERTAAAFNLDPQVLGLAPGEGPGFRCEIVAARPEVSRSDRRLIQVFANGRRIQEYSLVQAVDYAYGEYLSGGNHPLAFVFLQVEPEMVDFNIHPAKREARFRNLPLIHERVVGTLRSHLRQYNVRVFQPHPTDGPSARPMDGPSARLADGPSAGPGRRAASPAGSEKVSPPPAGVLPFPVRPMDGPSPHPVDGPSARPMDGPSARPMDGPSARSGAIPAPGPDRRGPGKQSVEEGTPAPIRYLGQLFRLFLVAEWRDRLFLVDQHAAHERLLYEGMLKRGLQPQALLIPIELEASPDEAEYLEERREALTKLGIRVDRSVGGSYEIAALPEDFLAIEEEELAAAILKKGSLEELSEALLSLAACHLAIKDGEDLDPISAQAILEEAFLLENARCPHGRPLWIEISRQDLEARVGRK